MISMMMMVLSRAAVQTHTTDWLIRWSDRSPKNQQKHEKSRFYYINGLRDLFVQIDMVLTFHVCHGIPGKHLSPR